MDVRGYVDENAAGFFDALLKGAEAAAYLWDEFATAADDLTVAR
jgi:hypothetical protein